MEGNTASPPSVVSEGNLWSIGGNWQSSAESDILGTLHNSSLILDEMRSGVNAYVAENIRLGKYKHLNLIGIDNVCDHGLEIVDAINNFFY